MTLSSDLEVGRAHVVRRHRSVRLHSAVRPATQRRERAVSVLAMITTHESRPNFWTRSVQSRPLRPNPGKQLCCLLERSLGLAVLVDRPIVAVGIAGDVGRAKGEGHGPLYGGRSRSK